MDAQESERENEQSARDAANEAAASLWSVNGERLRFIDPEEFTDEILLSLVDGVGSITTDRLLTRFGSAINVLDAPLDELQRVDKVGPTLAHKIAQARSFDVEPLFRFCRENDIRILSINDARYPSRLREIVGAPRVLYVRGKLQPKDRYAIAMVGTRDATTYGRAQATRLARELVEAGFTVVSGLALGIDGCAHRGALDARGRTLAVLGGGVTSVYPREHEDLAGRIIASGGALISEYYPLTTPLRGNFPARNRIISGLSIGVVVVESGKRGGSLITAQFAAEQNRDVFAVPGPIDRENSKGCHQLLRDGAALVETVDDIIEAIPAYDVPPQAAERQASPKDSETEPGTLGISSKSIESINTRKKDATPDSPRSGKAKKEKKSQASASERQGGVKTTSEEERRFAPLPELRPEERAIVDALGEETLQIDELIRKSGLPASKVIGLVAALEFKQVLRRREGNSVSRRTLP
ncbi:MAG: DNA-processing protein DprA [Thermoguttaceae bacterium]|nr:DNA-processing protein DprA [Thermoguttaceae bacterium]